MSLPRIEGIFNYCDRWCERCSFTSRCAIFDEDSRSFNKDIDEKNRAFRKRLGENIHKATDLLRKAARDAGLNVAATEAHIAEILRRDAKTEMEVRKHVLIVSTAEYGVMTRDWLKTQPGMLERLEHLKTELTLGVETNEGAKRETRVIKESLATIQWYCDFINDKLSRALAGKLGNGEVSIEYEPLPHHYDGSAKIAMIAIDRSIDAWSEIFKILPAEEDHFLKVLSLLERIKKLVLAEFPLASSFIRPGFDQ